MLSRAQSEREEVIATLKNTFENPLYRSFHFLNMLSMYLEEDKPVDCIQLFIPPHATQLDIYNKPLIKGLFTQVVKLLKVTTLNLSAVQNQIPIFSKRDWLILSNLIEMNAISGLFLDAKHLQAIPDHVENRMHEGDWKFFCDWLRFSRVTRLELIHPDDLEDDRRRQLSDIMDSSKNFQILRRSSLSHCAAFFWVFKSTSKREESMDCLPNECKEIIYLYQGLSQEEKEFRTTFIGTHTPRRN